MGGTEVAQRPEVFRTHTLFRQHSQQCRLPGTIGPSQQDALARGQLEGDVPDQNVVTVADGKVVRRMYVVDSQCFVKSALGHIT